MYHQHESLYFWHQLSISQFLVIVTEIMYQKRLTGTILFDLKHNIFILFYFAFGLICFLLNLFLGGGRGLFLVQTENDISFVNTFLYVVDSASFSLI